MLELLNLYEQAMEKMEGFVHLSWGRLEDGTKSVTVNIKKTVFTFDPDLKTKYDENRYDKCIAFLEGELGKCD